MDKHICDLPRSEREHLVEEWVFNSRNRQILKRRLLDSVTIEKLAEEFDMSDAQIKNIINKELSIIASKIS